MMAKDPYKYFRVEAKELLDGLGQGILQIEKNQGRADEEMMSRLLRLSHTLKGAARVVGQREIAELSHHIEDVFASSPEVGLLIPQQINELFQSIDKALAILKSLTAPLPQDPPLKEESFSHLRIEMEDLEKLLRLAVDTGAHPKIREKIIDLRLLPANTLFNSLQRSVRDAAESLQKKVELKTAGGENRLDASVLRAMGEALLHVVRNGVAHGIETDREARGKNPVGQITLKVERRGNRVAFICQDDGPGIDWEKIGEGNREKATRLLLQRGFSTTSGIDYVSGRGVGLNVVDEIIRKLKGEIKITSEPGEGFTLEMVVPVSLESFQVLTVDTAKGIFAIPFDSIQKTMCFKNQKPQIAQTPQEECFIDGENSLPFAFLDKVWPGESFPIKGKEGKDGISLVILQAGNKSAAIGVKRILGTSDVLVHPLPPILGPVPLAAGAYFDEEGFPRLVVDPVELVAAVCHHRTQTEKDDAVSSPVLPILVIDDSLTTRMLEKTILESAGYGVVLATSAEEGLQLARQKDFSLFVVDVEMPGMNGFEFISLTQTDSRLRQIPAILVTSKSSAEDFQHGHSVGAKAYMVKSEFDENKFLGTIRQLVE